MEILDLFPRHLLIISINSVHSHIYINYIYFLHSIHVCIHTFIDGYIDTELTEDFFSNLIANAPKLKSIHLSNSKMSVSHQFMYNFCKNSNIFVSFKSQSFEDFLLDKDINVFGKYKRLEKTYKEWSSNNPEYSSL